MKAILTLSILLFSLGLRAQVQTISEADLHNVLHERASDTTYVVNLWATWCKPCVEELPTFKEVAKIKQGQPYKFVFISLDKPDDVKKVNAFIKRQGLPGTHYLLKKESQEWMEWIHADFDGAIPATAVWRRGQQQQQFHAGQLNKAKLIGMISGAE